MAAVGTVRKDEIIGEMKAYIGRMDPSLPPPIFAKHAYRLINELTGIADPYRNIKESSNAEALKLVPAIRKIIGASETPLITALKLSAGGNILDHGVPANSPGMGTGVLEDALAGPIDAAILHEFAADAGRARRFLIIADNSGEIVFDRELIRLFPAGSVTCCVRGFAIQNDATREDAAQIGLSEAAQVIDTGDATPGIDLAASSRELLKELRGTDLVLLKGQGNFETLFDADLAEYMRKGVPLYFLLKVKCGHVADAISRPLGETVMVRKISW